MSGHGGRHPGQDKLDRQITLLWNQGHKVAFIAQKLGFNHGSSVSHAAKRLGLPRRKDYIRRGTTAATLASVKKREDACLVRLEQAIKKAKPVGPQPTQWRCGICAGASLDGPNHAKCLKRLWLAGVPIRELAARGAA
jgi:hypothetical protein